MQGKLLPNGSFISVSALLDFSVLMIFLSSILLETITPYFSFPHAALPNHIFPKYFCPKWIISHFCLLTILFVLGLCMNMSELGLGIKPSLPLSRLLLFGQEVIVSLDFSSAEQPTLTPEEELDKACSWCRPCGERCSVSGNQCCEAAH